MLYVYIVMIIVAIIIFVLLYTPNHHKKILEHIRNPSANTYKYLHFYVNGTPMGPNYWTSRKMKDLNSNVYEVQSKI